MFKNHEHHSADWSFKAIASAEFIEYNENVKAVCKINDRQLYNLLKYSLSISNIWVSNIIPAYV